MNINDITSVKLSEDGNTYSTNLGSVPKGHRFELVVKEWEKVTGNVIEPCQTQAEKDAEVQNKVNNEARAYLASTDWYVIRLQESGTAIPQAILDARTVARSQVVEVV